MKSLTIEGNHALSDRAISKKILTSKTGWWPFAAKRYFDPVAWSTDLERVKRLYRSEGYYQAEVVRDQVTPRPPGGVDLALEVRENEPTRISSLDVTGLEALTPEARAKLLKSLSLRTDAVFEESAWAAGKEQLESALRNRGYAEVAVSGQALVDTETRKAALTIAVRLGKEYRFGDILVDVGGGTAIKPAWIWDEVRLAIPEGKLFGDEPLKEAQRRVSAMGVLTAVKVLAGTPDAATGKIPVLVETREGSFHTLKFGGGVRVDQIRNEARAISEWTNRDFRGGMRRLTLHVEAGWAFIPNVYDVARDDQSTELRSGPIARVRLEFEQPRFLGLTSLRARSSLDLQRTLEQTYDDLGGALVNGVVWQPRASLSLFTAYHLQGDFVQGPPGASVLTAPLTLGCETTTDSCIVWLSYVEQTITWDGRDNALEPRNGAYASLSLQEGGGPLGGDFTYIRVLPEVRGFVSLGARDRLTFATRLRVGDLLPKSGNPDDSAVVTRFYAGGAQSMRGFNERRLSPLLLTQLPVTPGHPTPAVVTLPVGGDGLVDGSFEVRYALTDNLVLATFLDYGQVSRGQLDVGDFMHLLLAVGVGLRYRTPVGPIRVDLARRLEVGRPPPLLTVDAAGNVITLPYQVNDSCFGLGGSGRVTVVTDSLCVLSVSIGEAF